MQPYPFLHQWLYQLIIISIQPPGISSTVPANFNLNVIVSNHNQSNGVAGNRNSYQQEDYSRDMSMDRYMEWYRERYDRTDPESGRDRYD